MKIKRIIAVLTAVAITLTNMEFEMGISYAETMSVSAMDSTEGMEGDGGAPDSITPSRSTPSNADWPDTATPGNAIPAGGVDTGERGGRSLTDDSGLVTVEAEEGSLPEGAWLSVQTLDILDDDAYADTKAALWDAAKEELRNFLRVYAYDIQIYDADGEPIQPERELTVTIRGIDLDGSENAALYHIADDDSVSKVEDVYGCGWNISSAVDGDDVADTMDDMPVDMLVDTPDAVDDVANDAVDDVVDEALDVVADASDHMADIDIVDSGESLDMDDSQERGGTLTFADISGYVDTQDFKDTLSFGDTQGSEDMLDSGEALSSEDTQSSEDSLAFWNTLNSGDASDLGDVPVSGSPSAPMDPPDICFRTHNLGLYALAMDSGISTLADNRTFHILVGESVVIRSNRGLNFGWTSSDFSVVSVKGNGDASWGAARSATITGLAPGTVTITHFYGFASLYTESYTVIVSYKPDLVLKSEISGSELAYVRTHNGSYAETGNTFVNVSNGTTTIQNYMSVADPNTQILFFVKPMKNRIIVDLGDGRDKYSVTEQYGSSTSFKGKSNWDKVVKEAAYKGYVAYYGATRNGLASNNNNTINLRVRSLEPPAMEVTAVPSKTENVSLGDKLSFTVTITPATQLVDNYGGKNRTIDLTVDKKEVRSATINGKKYENIVKNTDGTFTIADYVTTEQDCREGEIRLTVDAVIRYSYKLDVTDRNGATGTVVQTAEVEKTAVASAAITKSNFGIKVSVTNKTHPGQPPVAGDMLSYRAEIRNYGELLRKLKFSDSLVKTAGKSLSINGGASISRVYSYTVTDADVLAGKITNTAMVVNEENGNVSSATLTIETAEASRRLKTEVFLADGADQNRLYQAGDVVPISVTVTDTGNITQKNITLTGTNLDFTSGSGYTVGDSGKTAQVAGLAPGKSVTLTARYQVRQEDIDDLDQIVSRVEVEGDEETGYDPQSVYYTFFLLDRNPGLEVQIEVANQKTAFDIGDEIQYEAVVSNTGNTDLDVSILDVVTAWNTPEQTTVDLSQADQSGDETDFSWDEATATGSLYMKPHSQHRFRYSHTVTEEDILKQCMTDTVTVSEKNGRADDVSDVAAVHFIETPELNVEIVETSEPKTENGYDLGEVIACRIRVENAGNVTLRDVAVAYSAVSNIPTSGTVSNTGNVPAFGSISADGHVSTSVVSGASSAPDATWKISVLAPGEENARTFDVRHTVTEEDVASKSVKLTAEAVSTYLLGNVWTSVTASDERVEDIVPVSTDISVEKEALIDSVASAGEVIPYLITVKNGGNHTERIVIGDTAGLDGALMCGTMGAEPLRKEGGKIFATLKPGASMTITYDYTVTDEDISDPQTIPDTDKAAVVNTVTVWDEQESEELDTDTAYVEIDSDTEKLSVRKQLAIDVGDGFEGFGVGETAEFDIVVKSRPGSDIKDSVRIRETLDGAEILPGDGYTLDGGEAVIKADSLTSEKPVTVKAQYMVTQADIDDFTSEGTVLKNSLDVYVDDTLSDYHPVAVIPLKAGEPKLTLSGFVVYTDGMAKNADDYPDEAADHAFAAGDPVEFEIHAENTGTVSLDKVEIHELLDGAEFEAGDGYQLMNGNRTARLQESLAPGETVTLHAKYLVTQEDIDTDDSLVNPICAYCAGKRIGGAEIQVPLLEKRNGISVEKTVTNKGSGTGENGSFRPGDEVLFDIEISNEGNTTLRYLIVKELLAGAYMKADAGSGMPAYTLEDRDKVVIAQLLPGQKVTVKAAYRITQADVDALTQAEAEAQIRAELDLLAKTDEDSQARGDAQPPTDVDSQRQEDAQPDVEEYHLINSVSVRNGRSENPNVEGFAEVEISGIEKRPGLTALIRLKNQGSGTDGVFQSGDNALFDIILWNSGNTTQEDVTVTELLEGALLHAGSGYTVDDGASAQISRIAPARTVTINASYLVTKKDIENRDELRNTLVVHGGKERENGQTISVVVPKDAPHGGTRPGSAGTGSGSGDSATAGPGALAEQQTGAQTEPGGADTQTEEGQNLLHPFIAPDTGDTGVTKYLMLLLASFILCCILIFTMKGLERDDPD